jgi:hypothetical protein
VRVMRNILNMPDVRVLPVDPKIRFLTSDERVATAVSADGSKKLPQPYSFQQFLQAAQVGPFCRNGRSAKPNRARTTACVKHQTSCGSHKFRPSLLQSESLWSQQAAKSCPAGRTYKTKRGRLSTRPACLMYQRLQPDPVRLTSLRDIRVLRTGSIPAGSC